MTREEAMRRLNHQVRYEPKDQRGAGLIPARLLELRNNDTALIRTKGVGTNRHTPVVPLKHLRCWRSRDAEAGIVDHPDSTVGFDRRHQRVAEDIAMQSVEGLAQVSHDLAGGTAMVSKNEFRSLALAAAAGKALGHSAPSFVVEARKCEWCGEMVAKLDAENACEKCAKDIAELEATGYPLFEPGQPMNGHPAPAPAPEQNEAAAAAEPEPELPKERNSVRAPVWVILDRSRMVFFGEDGRFTPDLTKAEKYGLTKNAHRARTQLSNRPDVSADIYVIELRQAEDLLTTPGLAPVAAVAPAATQAGDSIASLLSDLKEAKEAVAVARKAAEAAGSVLLEATNRQERVTDAIRKLKAELDREIAGEL